MIMITFLAVNTATVTCLKVCGLGQSMGTYGAYYALRAELPNGHRDTGPRNYGVSVFFCSGLPRFRVLPGTGRPSRKPCGDVLTKHHYCERSTTHELVGMRP